MCHYPEHAICQVAAWFKTQECWDLVEALTGVKTSSIVNGGLTCYARGHYLDEHTDRLVDNNGHRRKLAFTLTFSQNWDQTMGGILTLIPSDGEKKFIVPRFNSLTLMDVDTDFTHYVSPVETDKEERITLVGFFSIPAINAQIK